MTDIEERSSRARCEEHAPLLENITPTEDLPAWVSMRAARNGDETRFGFVVVLVLALAVLVSLVRQYRL